MQAACVERERHGSRWRCGSEAAAHHEDDEDGEDDSLETLLAPTPQLAHLARTLAGLRSLRLSGGVELYEADGRAAARWGQALS